MFGLKKLKIDMQKLECENFRLKGYFAQQAEKIEYLEESLRNLQQKDIEKDHALKLKPGRKPKTVKNGKANS